MSSPETTSRLREQRRRALFEAASQLAPSDRESYLKAQTGGDAELLHSILRLLAADATASGGVLDRPPHQRAAAPAPTMIGPYRPVRRLGSGGMADVYCCTAPGGGLAAVKLLRPGMSPDAESLRSFEREREILARLRHPNVCRIIDGGVQDGLFYIAMELIEGDRIDDHCRARHLTAREKLILFSRVLAGVEYFHREEIAHRDLKPSNILVTGSGQVKILDFGIAKFLEHSAGMTGSRPTSTPNAALTLRYASLEQLNGRLSGRSSDIYSLGVILYELLSGQHPYQTELQMGVPNLMLAMSQSQPAPLAGGVAAPVNELVLRALVADPGGRHRTAGQFLEHLRQCLEVNWP